VALAAKLDALSPLKVLGRGYSIAEKQGAVLRRAEDVVPGDHISVKLAGGRLGCLVEEIEHG
jgi:exodeoxyribonuclease VII large subunit